VIQFPPSGDKYQLNFSNHTHYMRHCVSQRTKENIFFQICITLLRNQITIELTNLTYISSTKQGGYHMGFGSFKLIHTLNIVNNTSLFY
jgi:hypothetical protein